MSDDTEKSDPEKVKAIVDAALQVFTREELRQMSGPSLRSLGHLISKRLDKPGPPPTHDELLGIRELVTEWLWHPALDAHAER